MTVRWGIIGCGDVCEVKSGPALRRVAGSEIRVVMRRDGAKARDYAARHGVPRWTVDAEAVIADPEVDAVYIATPPGSHCDFALRVAAAGKPAYVEKPMARNGAECQRMNAAFRAAGVPLFVAYYRRCLPRFLQVREWLAAGAIGRPTGVAYRLLRPAGGVGDSLPWRLRAEESGGGLFLDVGSHLLDLFDFLFGPLTEVAGHAATSGRQAVEDSVAMVFRTPDGVPGTAVWNFASGGERADRIEIFGTGGRIVCSCFGDEPVCLETPEGPRAVSLPNPPHIQEPLIETVVARLAGRGACPSTGDSAARTSAVMDRVLEAFYRGRDDAFWSRPETWSRADA